jgi:hypothetical protein
MPYVYLSEDSIEALLKAPAELSWSLKVHFRAALQPQTATHRWLLEIAREKARWIGAECVEIRDDAPVLPKPDGRIAVMAWLMLEPGDTEAAADPAATDAA